MNITKISKINNFGVFKSFDWDVSLAITGSVSSTYNFKNINIFYGRNYSGKTSLSKIMRALETKTISPTYESPDFQITLDDNSIITNSTLAMFTHPIHVYNSDFVKENLQFIHDDTQDVESFSVTLGGDNQKILENIKKLTEELGSAEENNKTGICLSIHLKKAEVKAANKAHADKDKALGKLLSDKATQGQDSIKYQSNKYGDQNYNITKMKSEILLVQKNSYIPLMDDVQASHEKLIIQIPKIDPSIIPKFGFNFINTVSAVEEILDTKVGESQKIIDLVMDGQLNKWAEDGLKYHESRTVCAFCSNDIAPERFDILRQHFDEESTKLKGRIEKGIDYLKEKQASLNFNIDKNEYYDIYHAELHDQQIKLSDSLEQMSSSLNELIEYLEDKKDNLFKGVELKHPVDYSVEIQAILDNIGIIRTNHIDLTKSLKEKQDLARNELRLNHIYTFLKEIEYVSKGVETNRLLQAIAPHETELLKLMTRQDQIVQGIKTEEDKLKSEGEACTRINNILKHDFGHQSLSLEAKEETNAKGKIVKFEIQRNKIRAHNLSEGECSLIAFCYFLAKIQDDLDQNKKPIIWIDDPISSLDSNHVFFIFSLIEQRVCKERKYQQLFISTHSLEFLKYLRRLTGVESDGALGTVKDVNRKSGYYLIQRNDSVSTIKQMPLYLSKFITEFNFLFEQIYKCATVQSIDDTNYVQFYNFGNNARKFLEIYTFYKFPSATCGSDSVLKEFWGDEIYKVMTDRINNEYSHMCGVLERGGVILEQPEMQKAARAIIKKVQADINQYNALLESVGIEQGSDILHPDNVVITD